MQTDKVKYCKADKADSAEILALQKIAYLSEAEKYDDFSMPPLLQTLPEIELEFDTHIFLKAVIGTVIVGSVRAFYHNQTWNIGRLIVHPDNQCKGIGGTLLGEIEKYLGNGNRLEIFTGSESLPTIRLYEKYGYRQCRTDRLSDKILLVFMEKFI